MLDYQENIPLSTLTTMRLGGLARFVAQASTQDDVADAVAFARTQGLPWFVLGGGSNVVAQGDFHGLIILNRIKGFERLAEDSASVALRIGAGEVWDSVAERTANAGLSGVEAMSAIPGCAGSTPVQNVGAYGQEIADTLVELEAYDTDRDKLVIMSAADCGFSYRDSIFKATAHRRHIITSITLRLSKYPLKPPFYPSLAKFLDENAITDYTPASIRKAVIAIRGDKLPDPKEVASAGSFFKNPVLEGAEAERLLARFPDAPHWEMPEGKVKLAAGWLIDAAGLKS
ncbi:MAG: UDP-N-acetylmuramate dehydrogenase, partial [Eggerthellaceae bacterium]|nr:UDP-N-acetylmuramate dehydrogenase [Eggerthellaceae bacterium]